MSEFVAVMIGGLACLAVALFVVGVVQSFFDGDDFW